MSVERGGSEQVHFPDRVSRRIGAGLFPIFRTGLFEVQSARR